MPILFYEQAIYESDKKTKKVFLVFLVINDTKNDDSYVGFTVSFHWAEDNVDR